MLFATWPHQGSSWEEPKLTANLKLREIVFFKHSEEGKIEETNGNLLCPEASLLLQRQSENKMEKEKKREWVKLIDGSFFSRCQAAFHFQLQPQKTFHLIAE